jgi:uncharacterized membrane protein
MARLGGRWSRTTWVLMLLAVIGLAAGWETKAPCLHSYTDSSGRVVLDWQNWRQYTDYCYSDTIPLYGIERLQDGGLPYKTGWRDQGDTRTRYMEYPVVTGMLQYGVTVVTKAYVRATGETENPDPPEVVTYFTVMAAVLAVGWLVAVGCTIPLAARRRDVALMALSPLVAVHVFTNFDPLAVALAAGGLLAWARKRPLLAGVLLGIGAAAKLYPVFILGALLVLCLRAGKLRPWAIAFAGAVVAWLVVNLPIAVLYRPGWWEFFRLNSTRPADHDSIYHAVEVFTGWSGFDGPLYAGDTPSTLNLVTLALFGLVCLGVAIIALTAPQRPRVASLAFLIVAGFLLTNKVWSPQYSLWLVPLAVLALPRWIPLLLWMSVDAYVWYPRLGYFLGLAEPGRGNSPEVFLSVVLLRDVLVLVVCGLVVRTVYRPEADPVRQGGIDDPAGGPLNGAPDRFRIGRGPTRARRLKPALPRSPESRRGRTEPDPQPSARSTP